MSPNVIEKREGVLGGVSATHLVETIRAGDEFTFVCPDSELTSNNRIDDNMAQYDKDLCLQLRFANRNGSGK